MSRTFCSINRSLKISPIISNRIIKHFALWLIALPAFALDKDISFSIYTIKGIFFQEDGARKIQVKDGDDILQMIEAIRLVRKEPCLCDHLWAVTFTSHLKGKEPIKVRFCDHCFNIISDKGTSHYRMMPKFYQVFKKYERQPRIKAEQKSAPNP